MASQPRPRSSYLDSHTDAGYGAHYNEAYARAGYYRAQWVRVERPLLRATLEKWSQGKQKCLDFACGTGRITSVACEHFPTVVGVDVSAEMLAENQCQQIAELIRVDICKEDIGRRFDVALAFRFFLNADPDLRDAALKALRNHLEEDGILICNIHMQATSPMGLAYRVLRLFGLTRQNILSTSAFVHKMEQSGFAILDKTYYGFLPRPGPLFASVVDGLVAPVDKWAQKLRLPNHLAQSCLIVAKRIDKPSLRDVTA